MSKTLIYNAAVVTGVDDRAPFTGFVVIDGDIIAAVSEGEPDAAVMAAADRTVDARGAYLMPGAIDIHVHFREPGLTHKATIASESRAAVAGGVTSYVDMPNCVPQTVTLEALEQKRAIAAKDSLANYSFYIGATADNLDDILSADYSSVAGIKLFMGSSTGGMLVDDEHALSRLFEAAPALITVHAEDEATIAAARAAIKSRYGDSDVPVSLHSELRPAEACFKASERAVRLARRYGARLNIAHLTTAAELNLLEPATVPLVDKKITAEVSPHHLLWTDADYASRGSRIKMNPAVKTAADRAALRDALASGRIDVIATDHAPHLLADKAGDLFKAASGAPLVQFSLPMTLDLFGPVITARAMAANPATLLRIDRRGHIASGCYADLVLVERCEPHTITDSEVLSLCGWTPLDGCTTSHRVLTTWVNGHPAYDHGRLAPTPHAMPLRFNPGQCK